MNYAIGKSSAASATNLQHDQLPCMQSGDTSTPAVSTSVQVQELAAAAMSWCAARGGDIEAKDMVWKLSKLGAGGRHPQNAERDLQATIRMYGQTVGAEIETCRVRLWDPRQETIIWTDLAATLHILKGPAPSNYSKLYVRMQS